MLVCSDVRMCVWQTDFEPDQYPVSATLNLFQPYGAGVPAIVPQTETTSKEPEASKIVKAEKTDPVAKPR